MNSIDIPAIKRLSANVRKHVLRMTHRSGGSHVGPMLSCVDIMTSVYAIARVTPRTAGDPDRDRVILSKGHAAATHYAVLAELGFCQKEILDTYCADDSPLSGHPDIGCVPGIETTTGSLGHGLSVGVGMALAARIDKRSYRVFVVLGDGECNEGSVWEAALAAGSLKLNNLIAIIDRNGQQGMGKTETIIALEPLDQKWRAFGWNAVNVDGHDHRALTDAIRAAQESDLPTAIIAKTVKGKGVSYMEDQLLWHYRNPNDEQLAQAIREIDEGAR